MSWILVATDGSEPARHAVKYAADLARRLGEGLRLAYVVEPPTMPPDGAFPLTEILNDHEAWAKRFLADEAREFGSPGLPVSTQVHLGSPADSLARMAEAPDVEMVVVGSRGRGAMARLVLGSVAARLSQICPKPLLILRDHP